MSLHPLTYNIVMAISRDAGNHNMRKYNRAKWNRNDYTVAADTANRLFKLQTQPRGFK